MNPFSSGNKVTTPSTNTNPITSGFNQGSGAEQDRYDSHFGIGTEGLDRVKQAALAKGEGAEQDRYASHFSPDHDQVKQAAQSILNAKGSGAEQDTHAAHFGLGADGWARAQKLAQIQGNGAEQDRYGSHFSTEKGNMEQAAQSIQDKAKDVADSFKK